MTCWAHLSRLSVGLLLLVAAAVPRAGAQEGPNVVLVVTDDQGWGDVHTHGNEQLDTPNLDRLAAEGVRFDRFYVNPVCAPTRAALLTGRYYLRTGTHGVTRGHETMRAEEVTIAEALRDAGYETALFGKWHNGAHYPHDPNGQGFDEFLGFAAGHWNNYFDTDLVHNDAPVATNGYVTDVLTDAALDFIEASRERPFFLYLAYNTPHSPFQVPDRYYDKYRARGFDEKNASVYGMVENLDDNVGRILERIAALGLDEETIVVFLTDNGPNGDDRYNGDLRGAKGSVHEGGVRVPLFVRWPGRLPAGSLVREIAADIDLFPTLLALAGVPIPEGPPLDGTSLVPLLTGMAAGWPDRKLFQHWSGDRGVTAAPGAVRTSRWRGVRTREGFELYDMPSDPGERTDVAALYPRVAAELRAAYEAWFDDVTRQGFEPIPIPVGHAERPRVELPGHEAFLQSAPGGAGISYVGHAGWANDWVTSWASTEAYPFWNLDVVRPGRYEVTIRYTAGADAVGARLRAEAGGEAAEGVVTVPHDPAPVPSPDRVPRKEVYEKVWKSHTLGVLDLAAGRTQLRLRAAALPGGRAPDVKSVLLTRLSDTSP